MQSSSQQNEKTSLLHHSHTSQSQSNFFRSFVLLRRFYIALLLSGSLLYTCLLVNNVRTYYHARHWRLHPSHVEDLFLQLNSNATFAESLERRLTDFPHIAGTAGDFETVDILRREWEGALHLKPSDQVLESGTRESRHAMEDLESNHITVHVDTYHSLLTYPLGNSSVSLHRSDGALVYQASLKEEPTARTPMDTPSFHGFSKAGYASGPLVYANFGRIEDFDLLAANNISVKGAIVICRYGRVFRGLKVLAAEKAGAVGALIYSDPASDGEMTEANGHQPYPEGPARMPTSIERGSAQLLSIYPGDPLTPGYPSYKNATRLSRDSEELNMPKIPSIPISFHDAFPLLASLNGKGPVFPDWIGGLEHYLISYNVGPSEGAMVRMNNQVEEKINPIWNIYAKIPGQIKDEIVLIGCHRDAWVRGAADPISGTVTISQIVKSLGTLVQKGWRPMRTIIIASWDAEEAGLIGSTEFGEDFAHFLQKHVAVYFNTDLACAGSQFLLRASPSLGRLFKEIGGKVRAPDEEDETLADYIPSARDISPLGSGSDFTVFLEHLGIASSDVAFKGGRKDAVYHYHSIHDSFEWMARYGDPGFKRNIAISQFIGLSALRAADSLILPLNLEDYAHTLTQNLHKLKDLAASDESFAHVDFHQAERQLEKISAAAEDLHHRARKITQTHSSSSQKEMATVLSTARHINRQLMAFERSFIDKEGLPGRKWYRHLGVASGRWLGYGATIYPGVKEALTLDRSSSDAQRELDRVVAALKRAREAIQSP